MRSIARARVRFASRPIRSGCDPTETAALVGDTTRLRAAPGWQPTISFEPMLDDLLDYWRARSSAAKSRSANRGQPLIV